MTPRRPLFILGVSLLLSLSAAACGGELPTSIQDLSDLAITSTPIPTPTPTPLPPPTPETDPYSIDGLTNFMSTIDSFNEINRQIEASRYMGQLPGSPLIGERKAAIVYQGPGFEVEFISDLSSFVREEALALTQVADTDMWVLILELEPTTRLDYRLVIDGDREVLDPLNPLTEPSGFGPHSKLVMSGYVTPPEFATDRPPLAEAERGRLTQHTLDSDALAETRTIFVYEPAIPPTTDGGTYPTVYFNDGTDYLNFGNATELLDRLIAAGEIPPLVAVFIPPIDRRIEYNANLDYVNFLAEEVLPFMRATYPVSTDPAETGIFGASMGGLAAGHAAVSRPDLFGLVGSQSGAFSYNNAAFLRLVERSETVDVKFHLIIGTYETQIAGDPTAGNFIEINRETRDLLIQKGYLLEYQEFPEGHSWGFWQHQMGRGLQYLFGEGEAIDD